MERGLYFCLDIELARWTNLVRARTSSLLDGLTVVTRRHRACSMD